jgi:hypothetical protein
MSTGGTIGYPITGGIGTDFSIADPLPYTWLSLDRYARIMGIAPPHFFGAYSTTVFPANGACTSVWPRHSWQDSGRVSREEIADKILEAEAEIAEILGFNLAPTFVINEMHQYPQHWRRTAFPIGGTNVRGAQKQIGVKSGKLISGGVRTTELIGTATTSGGSLVYTDEDADGFYETATITMATTETNACEMLAFVPNKAADSRWEIRQARSKAIAGGNATMVFHSWLLIDPAVDSAYPTDDSYRAIDISTTANFLTSVDIYRVYVDNTQVSARFFWERSSGCSYCSGTGCDACSLAYQDGCTFVGNVDEGLIVPAPATYNASNQIWERTNWSVGRDPDQVRVSYYAGAISQQYFAGTTCDPLQNKYARAISWIATARLDKPPCSCPEVIKNFETLREDLSAFGSDVTAHFVSPRILDNPFGTRRGEVMAWNLIGRMVREYNVEVAVI